MSEEEENKTPLSREIARIRQEPFLKDQFRKNPNLRGGNKVEDIPREDYEYYVREIVKCKNDIVYFANNYFNIITPGIGRHIIKTYPRQSELIKEMCEHDRLCVLASRQVGKTTSYNVVCLHTCLFQQDRKILILGNKAAAAVEFLSRIKLAYELMPKWLKPGLKEFNKSSVEFANGCKIEACATTPDSARGKACDMLIIDEMAFVPPKIMDDLWSSVYPIVSSAKGTKVIVVSTPNGTGNMFHQIYEAGANGTDPDGWKSFRFLWDEVPGRDAEWKRKQIASFNGDMSKWNQEFGAQFLGSTNTLIPSSIIEFYKKYFITRKLKGLMDTFEIEYCDNYEIKKFVKPKEDHCYVIGCDIADGVGGDSTVIKIFDISNPLRIEEVVHFDHKYIPTVSVPYVLAKLGCMYNLAPIMMESNNMGRSVLDILFNIFEYTHIVDYGSKGKGIYSSNKLKIEACEHFRKYMAGIIDNKVILKDRELITELEDFQKVKVGGLANYTYKCKSKNDDNIMAAVWGFYILADELIDYQFDVKYEYIGINRYPVQIKSYYSQADIEYERTHFERRVEDAKKLLTVHEMDNSFLTNEQVNPLTQREIFDQKQRQLAEENDKEPFVGFMFW